MSSHPARFTLAALLVAVGLLGAGWFAAVRLVNAPPLEALRAG